MSAQVRKWNIYSDWCGVFLGLQDNGGECRFCDETLCTACLRQCGSNGFICPSSKEYRQTSHDPSCVKKQEWFEGH